MHVDLSSIEVARREASLNPPCGRETAGLPESQFRDFGSDIEILEYIGGLDGTEDRPHHRPPAVAQRLGCGMRGAGVGGLFKHAAAACTLKATYHMRNTNEAQYYTQAVVA